MNKNIVLKIVLILFVISLTIPVYYVTNIVTTTLVLSNIQNKAKTGIPNIEYLVFNNLTSALDYNFNNTPYKIFLSATKTHDTPSLKRNAQQNITIENIAIAMARGTIQNIITKDIYTFTTPVLNVSQNMTHVSMKKDFHISLYSSTKEKKIDMHGDSLIFNIAQGTIASDKPVIFTSESGLLFGETFFMHRNTVTLKGNVFIDSLYILASSNTIKILTDSNTSIVNNQNLSFQSITLHGNAKIFDKQNKIHMSADKIILHKSKQEAELIGNVTIQRSDGTAHGEKMTYNFAKKITNISGNGEKRTNLKIQY